MKYRHHSTTDNHSNSICRICSPMGTNILLRGYSNYKSTLSHPLHWHYPRRVNLRGVFRRQSHPDAIFRIPLYLALHHYSICTSSPPLPSRNWLQQPIWPKPRLRQNSIPPILHHQRPTRGAPFINSSHNFGFIFPRCSRRPRQLYPSKSTQHPSTH